MTTPSWPGGLPVQPLRDGFSVVKQDNRAVFQPEVGDAKVRRRFTAVVKDFGCTFRLSPSQKTALDLFHDQTLSDGVLPFSWTDPQNGEPATFRFLSPPDWISVSHNIWQANCKIRRIP